VALHFALESSAFWTVRFSVTYFAASLAHHFVAEWVRASYADMAELLTVSAFTIIFGAVIHRATINSVTLLITAVTYALEPFIVGALACQMLL
jgi:hypothetical protein